MSTASLSTDAPLHQLLAGQPRHLLSGLPIEPMKHHLTYAHTRLPAGRTPPHLLPFTLLRHTLYRRVVVMTNHSHMVDGHASIAIQPECLLWLTPHPWRFVVSYSPSDTGEQPTFVVLPQPDLLMDYVTASDLAIIRLALAHPNTVDFKRALASLPRRER